MVRRRTGVAGFHHYAAKRFDQGTKPAGELSLAEFADAGHRDGCGGSKTIGEIIFMPATVRS